ncbi:MAG TPA: hypothetical protein VI603_08835 [Saprospiraceae bacterium]|nr:hypothetical protein [Saprospiraceae bacterium]
MIFWATPAFSQHDDRDTSDQVSTRIEGIALDVFPVLNGIFSDDSNSDIFTVNYIWGHNRNHYEAGVSPHYRRTNTDTDDPVLKTFGFNVRLFHGKTRILATRWFITFGMTYEYQLLKEVSKTEGNNSFEFTTIQHAGGLGPQLLFGYRIADQVWIRSRIAGLLQYTSISTKIKDGSVEAADQNLNILNFDITPPSFLELVYIF